MKGFEVTKKKDHESKGIQGKASGHLVISTRVTPFIREVLKKWSGPPPEDETVFVTSQHTKLVQETTPYHTTYVYCVKKRTVKFLLGDVNSTMLTPFKYRLGKSSLKID